MVKIDAHPEPISGTTSNITSHKWCVIPKLIKKKNGIEIEWLLFNKYIMYIFYIRFRSSKINHDEKRKIGRHQKFSSQKKSRHSLEITNPFRIYTCVKVTLEQCEKSHTTHLDSYIIIHFKGFKKGNR